MKVGPVGIIKRRGEEGNGAKHVGPRIYMFCAVDVEW